MTKMLKGLALALVVCNSASAGTTVDWIKGHLNPLNLFSRQMVKAGSTTGEMITETDKVLLTSTVASLAGLIEYVRYSKLTAGLSWADTIKFLVFLSVDINDEQILSGMKIRRIAALGTVGAGISVLSIRAIYNKITASGSICGDLDDDKDNNDLTSPTIPSSSSSSSSSSK